MSPFLFVFLVSSGSCDGLTRTRHTKRRRDLLAAEASRRHGLHGETIVCGSRHVVVRMHENTWDLEGNVACGVWICHQVGHVRRCAM